MNKLDKLGREFYEQDALTLAKDLLGKVLVRKINGELIYCQIVETEAYIGPEDKACHAYLNKRTKRTDVMFCQGGVAYVYLIYGMYYCLNVVSGKKDIPEAVLIRAVEPLSGIETIKLNRNIKSKKIEDLTNGPGKLCIALQIDKSFNGYDLINGEHLTIMSNGLRQPTNIISSARINIDYAEEYKDKPWRFYLEGNSFVSRSGS